MAATQLLIVMIAAIGLTIFADRIRFQAPLLLAIVGVAVSFLPGVPRFELEPHMILGIVLPPLLYAAALEFSFFSFVRRFGSILNLGVGLVVVTTVVAAAVAFTIAPALSIPGALILGAVIAPIDAVSAVAIGHQLGLPHRLMTLLKGESLVNDAAALTLFAAAVAAATGGHSFIQSTALAFLYAAVVGVLVGVLVGAVAHWIRVRLTRPELMTALAVIIPFATYTIAEDLHASGVVAVVFAGFSLGHNSAGLRFDGRIEERSVWKLIDTLLETFAFAYMGLQMRFVIGDALGDGVTLTSLVGISIAVFIAITLTRILWILGSSVLAKARYRIVSRRPTRDGRKRSEPLSTRENLVLSWTGMRGVVTLAAAAGTPLLTAAGADFAEREIILPVAYAVAIATLLIQGLTLPLVIKWLALRTDDDVRYTAEQNHKAWQVVRDASKEALAGANTQDAADFAMVRKFFDQERAREQEATEDPAITQGKRKRVLAIASMVFTSQRGKLIEARNTEQLDDDVMRKMLELVDLQEGVMAMRQELAASTEGQGEKPKS